MRSRLVVTAALVAMVAADVYMHSPRGSNDRNCEKNVNRNNGNRLFDSQNNAKGGYACGRSRTQGPDSPTQTMKLYAGSKTTIEWTNQHGCGANAKTGCDIVLQYACEDTLDPTGKWRSTDKKWVGAPRDGTPKTADTDAATDRIPDEVDAAKATTVDTRRYGMHESFDFYEKCKQRERNKGLYTADQDMNRNDARSTRQNNNGNRRGLECPEERDYYPYWAPNPWRDVAVITSNPQRCNYYKAESTTTRGECVTAAEFYGPANGQNLYSKKCMQPNVGDRSTSQTKEQGLWPNNQQACENMGHKWQQVRYDIVHPDSVALRAAQKVQESKGSSIRYELFKLPQSATCAMDPTTSQPKTSEVSLTDPGAWGEDPKEANTFQAGTLILKAGKARQAATVSKFRRPLRVEFTVKATEQEHTKWYKTEFEVGVLGEMNTRGDLDGKGYAAFIGRGQKYTAVTHPSSGLFRWSPGAVGESPDFYSKAVNIRIDVLQNGWVKYWVDGNLVSEFVDDEYSEGQLFLANSGRDDVTLSKLTVIENFGIDKQACAAKVKSLVAGSQDTQSMHVFSSVSAGSVASCAGGDSIAMPVVTERNGFLDTANYLKISGYFKPTANGQFSFGVSTLAGAELMLKSGDATETIVKVSSTQLNTRGTLAFTDGPGETTGWSSKVTNTLQDGVMIRGPWGGDVDEEEVTEIKSLQRTIASLKAHTHIRVSARFWALGSWDRETASLMVDGLQVWSRNRGVEYNNDPRGWVTGCGVNRYSPEGWSQYPASVANGSTWNSNGLFNCYYDLDVVVPHTAPTMQLQFSTNIAQGLADEAWAVSNVRVYTGTSAAALSPPSMYQGSKSFTLSATKSYYFAATVPTGSARQLKVWVKPPSAQMQPMETDHSSYRVCASPSCTNEIHQCQPKAAANCQCDDWSLVRPDLGLAAGSKCCGNPAGTLGRRGNWCYCTKASTSGAARYGSGQVDKFEGWSNDTVHTGAADKIHGPFDKAVGWISKQFSGLPAHSSVQVKFKLFAFDQWNNEPWFVTVDGARTKFAGAKPTDAQTDYIRTRNDWNNAKCDATTGFAVYRDSAKMPNLKDPKASWKHVVCVKEVETTMAHSGSTLDLSILSALQSAASSRSWAVGAVTVSTTLEPKAELFTEKIENTDRTWAYCDPGLSASNGKVTASLADTSSEDDWSEPSTDVEALMELSAEPETVDCLDGKSSTSRENQLGNARDTANPDAKIPHGINANRYIWTVPSTPNKNCVLRLRYNISTSDYWAWDKDGTPRTDASVSNLGRRRRADQQSDNRSPIMQDPYIGIGDNPESTFLSLALNTNQYGRTFQDRSHVFEIAARPAGIPATAEIINVNVRGKRGNIVQTYPAVEYDFVPNDLCLNQGDYVHFQWTGSDFNPQRNPNDGEGSGDVPPHTTQQASRADRSNLVELDLTPRGTQTAAPTDAENGYPRSKFQNGAGKHTGEVALGMNYPAGYLSDFKNLETKYTGMFWKGGKPDKATIMKMAFIDQVETLKKKSKTCKTLPELNKEDDKNKRERDPQNCAKLNAADTPYFDGGVVKMEKAGKFPFYSSRNNNFSNRNQAGVFCVSDGKEGTCSRGKGCAEMVEEELLSKQRSDQSTLIERPIDQSDL